MLEHTHSADTAPERVVVMGARGFVGGALMRRLQVAGIPALGLGREDVDLLADGAAQKLAALLQPGDAFVAVSALAPCKDADMLVSNTVLARSLVKALSLQPVAQVINISSDAVYGDSSEPMNEQSPLAPESLHGVMHLARELMFRSEVKAPLAALRPSLLYGAQDPHNGYGPNRFRRLAEKGEAIALFGEGEERRDHVFIDDVAEIALRVLLRRSRGALNIATGEVRSFRDIAQDVVRMAGSASTIHGTPRSGPMPHNGYRAFDVAGTSRAFPGFSYTPLAQGLRRSLSV
ncbi:MAG: NAD-dependent epimerase/dehydratase [Burkholderiales bacterium]|nr:NAD-dependent epimerase/dehydratase [Burkholderiales bacterium]